MINLDKLYDRDFRKALKQDVKKAFKSIDYEIDENYKFLVKTDTKSISYFVMPAYSSLLNASDLQSTQAAGKAGELGVPHTIGTAGSMSSAGSWGCATTCLSTIGSVGSVGSAGTGT